MAIEQYVTSTVSNAKGRGTIGSSYTSGGTSLVLTAGHGARFPSSGNFSVGVGSPTASDYEIFRVSSRSTDTLTVTGAQENTPAGNHAVGQDVIILAPTKVGFDALRGDMSGIGTFANLPSTTGRVSGDRYRTTDGPYEFIFDGSIWKAFARGIPVTIPDSSTFPTHLESTTDSIDYTKGGVVFNATATSGTHHQSLVQAYPTPSFTIDALMQVTAPEDTALGLITRDSGSGKVRIFFITTGNPSLGAEFYVQTYTATNGSFNSTELSDFRFLGGTEIYLRYEDDNTDIKLSYSTDGQTWKQVLSESRTTYFTPNQIGIFLSATSSHPVGMHLLGWKQF